MLPALAKAKQKAKGIYCLNNNKQMVLAWVLYAEDHDGYLPPNPNGKASRGWVNGRLNFTPGHRDNTNVLFLIGTKAQVGHVYPKLGPYTSSAGHYKCPADIYKCEMGGTKMPRDEPVLQPRGPSGRNRIPNHGARKGRQNDYWWVIERSTALINKP